MILRLRKKTGSLLERRLQFSRHLIGKEGITASGL